MSYSKPHATDLTCCNISKFNLATIIKYFKITKKVFVVTIFALFAKPYFLGTDWYKILKGASDPPPIYYTHEVEPLFRSKNSIPEGQVSGQPIRTWHGKLVHVVRLIEFYLLFCLRFLER